MEQEKKYRTQKVLWLLAAVLLFSFSMGAGLSLAQEKKVLLRLGATPSGTGWYFYNAQTATVLSQNLPNVGSSD